MPETPIEIVTIVEQLGGTRIFAMAFSHAAYTMHPPDGIVSVRFSIARALVHGVRSKATHVDVTLRGDDTYTVVALRVARQLGGDNAVTEVERLEMVYADALRSTVEDMTGLALTMGRIVRVTSEGGSR